MGQFMPAKPFGPLCESKRSQNRQTAGRSGDARRPAALFRVHDHLIQLLKCSINCIYRHGTFTFGTACVFNISLK